MYQVRLLKSAIQELEKLDRTVARRILNRINWLAINLENTKRETLSGDLAGFNKLRVGDYRVIYQVLEE